MPCSESIFSDARSDARGLGFDTHWIEAWSVDTDNPFKNLISNPKTRDLLHIKYLYKFIVVYRFVDCSQLYQVHKQFPSGIGVCVSYKTHTLST